MGGHANLMVLQFFEIQSPQRHMIEGEQVAVLGSIREGSLTLFSGLCGISTARSEIYGVER